MELIASIGRGWGWCGIQPEEVVGENDFGNLMVRDMRGMYWRICPEDLYCRVIAEDRAALDAVSKDQEFLRDWYATALVEQARERLGPLEHGRKYCLKIPGPLGGEYGGQNLAHIQLTELIEASGSMAQQIEGLPSGSKVQLQVTE